jgi:hypothetical protein
LCFWRIAGSPLEFEGPLLRHVRASLASRRGSWPDSTTRRRSRERLGQSRGLA